MPSRENRQDNRRANREALRDDAGERAILAEFLCAPSVAALADAIAKRLGGKAKPEDFLAEAGLAPAPLRVRRRS